MELRWFDLVYTLIFGGAKRVSYRAMGLATLFVRQPQHLDIPGMVRMNEIVAALFICQLRVHQEACPDWMRVSKRLWKTNSKALR